QRGARVRLGRVGAYERIRARLVELRAVRRAARAGSGAVGIAEARTPCAAAAQGSLSARQPVAVQPQVLPDLAAAVPRVRAPARPAARRNRRTRSGGVSPVQRTQSRMTISLAGGLLLAIGSAAALNWGSFVQHAAATALPPLPLRRPLRSLALL